MSEQLPHDPEREVSEGLQRLAREQLSEDDAEFIKGLDADDAAGYTYGRLLETGIDNPDEVLVKYGVLEEEDS